MNTKRKYLSYKKETKIQLRKFRKHKRNLKGYGLFHWSNTIFRTHGKLLSKSYRYYRMRADFRYFKTHKSKFKQRNFKKSKAYKLRYS